jgi:hypothetical protein
MSSVNSSFAFGSLKSIKVILSVICELYILKIQPTYLKKHAERYIGPRTADPQGDTYEEFISWAATPSRITELLDLLLSPDLQINRKRNVSENRSVSISGEVSETINILGKWQRLVVSKISSRVKNAVF